MPLKVCRVSLTHYSSFSAELANSIVVAKHNSSESCWVIIHEKVYDVRAPLSSQTLQTRP